MSDYRPEARILGDHIENGLTAVGSGIRDGLVAIAKAMESKS